jgi:hypothetical protein
MCEFVELNMEDGEESFRFHEQSPLLGAPGIRNRDENNPQPAVRITES